MDLLAAAEGELFRSNQDRKHPFRYFTLGTFGLYPEIRTVVKRKTEQGLNILFYTDTRSPKVEQIQQNNKVSALFYHPKKQLQVRMKGRAELIGKAHPEYSTLLNRIQQSPSLKDYTTMEAPGYSLETGKGLAYGEEIYFSGIRIHPEEIDILQLDPNAHKRSIYYKEQEIWKQQIVVP